MDLLSIFTGFILGALFSLAMLNKAIKRYQNSNLILRNELEKLTIESIVNKTIDRYFTELPEYPKSPLNIEDRLN